MDKGWIKLHRTIRNHWLWPQKKFSPFEAWLDLILSANHADAQVLIDGKLICVLRGSFITSELKLAARWGWARKTVHRFLDVLKKDKMVTTVATTKYTAISLTNYRVYQGDGTTLGTTKEQENIQVGCKTLPTNKNDKNVENEKEKTIYCEVIDYLNQKAGTKYRPVEAHKKLIRARVKEGYSLTDFLTVIDNKVADWAGSEQQKYLRPETLFGTKFDGYLNRPEGGRKRDERISGELGNARNSGTTNIAGKIPDGFWR